MGKPGPGVGGSLTSSHRVDLGPRVEQNLSQPGWVNRKVVQELGVSFIRTGREVSVSLRSRTAEPGAEWALGCWCRFLTPVHSPLDEDCSPFPC